MNTKLFKNVAIILGCSIAAKVLSFIWEAILAAYLGTSDQADAFYMVSSIFGILYPILDLGIWKVFLPAYKTKLAIGEKKEADTLANIAITLFFLLSMALVLFVVVLAKPLTILVAPGFSAEKKAITAQYLCISAPAYLLMATASAVGAMLQSRERFFGSQLRELGTHISKILYIFICYRYFGIYAAITAMIVGSVFRLLIQLPFINWKWKFRFDFHFKDKDVSTMIKGLPSVALTAAITHINGLVDKMVASGSGNGAVSCLNYGYKLVSVFSGMISTAIGTAVYPTMIQHIAEKEEDKLRKLLVNISAVLGFLIIPITCFCMLFSKEVVSAAFERGAFDASAVAATSGVFSGYCIGMLFVGVSGIVTNVFYGYGDTKITMYISIAEVAINIVFNVIFVRFWGVAGLAVASSIAAIISLSIRGICMRKYITLNYWRILWEWGKLFLLSLAACLPPYFLVTKLMHINVYLTLVIGLGLSCMLYFLLAILFHIEAMDFAKNMLLKKLCKRENTIGE